MAADRGRAEANQQPRQLPRRVDGVHAVRPALDNHPFADILIPMCVPCRARTCLPSPFSLGVAADPTEVLCSMQLSDINRLHEAFADSRSNQSSTFESGLALRRGV
jgi:hypothetical protein